VTSELLNSRLAARMASLTAQWTDDARTTAGSPEAGTRSSSVTCADDSFHPAKKSHISIMPKSKSHSTF
jgi:hypothetical protein